MNKRGKLSLIHRSNFRKEYELWNFKKAPLCIKYKCLYANIDFGFEIAVLGMGTLPPNFDYVVLRIRHSKAKFISLPRIVNYTCIMSVLDINGKERFPCTITYSFRMENSEYSNRYPDTDVEEKYIERSSILNNDSEYLRNNTLTVIVEGTIEIWTDYGCDTLSHWLPETSIYNFQVKEFRDDLEIHLRKDSLHAPFLIEHSKVFRDMWDVPMRESFEKRVLLRNEELPAFLCMLVFIETRMLIILKTTIFDLYKMADKYDVAIMLEECRKKIEDYIPKNASAIQDFAVFYDDAELKQSAETYIETASRESKEGNVNLKNENDLDEDCVCNKHGVFSSLISTVDDFKEYLNSLWAELDSIRKLNHPECVSDVQMHKKETEREEFDFYK